MKLHGETGVKLTNETEKAGGTAAEATGSDQNTLSTSKNILYICCQTRIDTRNERNLRTAQNRMRRKDRSAVLFDGINPSKRAAGWPDSKVSVRDGQRHQDDLTVRVGGLLDEAVEALELEVQRTRPWRECCTMAVPIGNGPYGPSVQRIAHEGPSGASGGSLP